ncbi:hypothetical protein FHU31_000081 [Mycolicibacterium fluoranthenivorans]|uniref:HNH nuclease domain-containing protein n=1 Tax=Mycolicibacterium fluoranthenivorans TaxID=258505 RepID=A0A7X5R4I7_9MYCO|nr:HNH endonuclease signature motif containing protein [Mycolicibacterium fluoranthenivorans]NIH93125.1 hypothetical protein [Mycolicibacterium fluoranthenivorans]
MFDLGGAGDAALIEALRCATRAEAVAAAQRWAIIAALVDWHCKDEDEARASAALDGWEYAAAEVSAACGLSREAAAGQMRIALALRDRLPKVGALLEHGEISAKTAAAITWRTRLVTDTEALALIDAALAGVAPTLGVLSQKNTETAIDVWIEKFDPVAVHCTRTAARSRCIEFGAQEDPAGTVAVWGRLLATDAAVLRARLTALAATVCEADPRTVGQRRADAMGLLAVDPTADRLTCLCGEPGCPAAGVDPRSAAVTVYVLTDTVPGAAADTPRDPGVHGDDLQGLRAPAAVTGTPGVIPGGGVVPAPLVAELVATGARVATLADTNDLTAEPRYRPSAKLAAWVRTRDLTCTFPGCHRGAQYCDLDHSVPWPGGATHPGNLAALCRTHHLLKTFAGWSTVQHPDGTHTWTNPTGHTYTTVPLTRILFPDKPIHTPAPPPTPAGSGSGVGDRGLAMPRRRRTRAHTHTARINAERRLNQHTLEQNATPPPF